MVGRNRIARACHDTCSFHRLFMKILVFSYKFSIAYVHKFGANYVPDFLPKHGN